MRGMIKREVKVLRERLCRLRGRVGLGDRIEKIDLDDGKVDVLDGRVDELGLRLDEFERRLEVLGG